MSSSRFSTRALVEAGVAVALAVVLDRITIFKMPQGGSVTAGSMIPIFLVALRHGPGLGITAGGVFGLVQLMLGGDVVHPVQAALDYPIAFGLLGLAGLRQLPSWLSVTLGIVGRYLAHVVSGVVFFGQYAPAGQNVWVYSCIYNATYYLPDIAISGLIAALLFLHPAIRQIRYNRTSS